MSASDPLRPVGKRIWHPSPPLSLLLLCDSYHPVTACDVRPAVSHATTHFDLSFSRPSIQFAFSLNQTTDPTPHSHVWIRKPAANHSSFCSHVNLEPKRKARNCLTSHWKRGKHWAGTFVGKKRVSAVFDAEKEMSRKTLLEPVPVRTSWVAAVSLSSLHIQHTQVSHNHPLVRSRNVSHLLQSLSLLLTYRQTLNSLPQTSTNHQLSSCDPLQPAIRWDRVMFATGPVPTHWLLLKLGASKRIEALKHHFSSDPHPLFNEFGHFARSG